MAELTDFLMGGLQVAAAYAGRPRVTYAGSGYPQGYAPGGGFAMTANDVGRPNYFDRAEMGYDCASGPPAPRCGGSAVYKRVCGEYRWVYPKRRRRKQLVTKSDAAGLATLKGILGNGKAMDTWIATH